MKYPMLSNRLTFKRINRDEYSVTDELTDEEFILGVDLARYARALDGRTDPFDVPGFSEEECRRLFRKLDKGGLIRRKRFQRMPGTLTFLWTLVFVRKTKGFRRAAQLYNALVMLLWLPVFTAGVICLVKFPPSLWNGGVAVGTIAGLAAGAVVHEAAHGCAALIYGGRVMELGLMFQLPASGAYTLMNIDMVKSKLRKLQIYAAGIEANMLLAGIAFILETVFPRRDTLFFWVAAMNAATGIFNLLLANGSDGMKMMDVLLGSKSFIFEVWGNLLYRSRRRTLRETSEGRAELAASMILAVMKLAIPAIVIGGITDLIMTLMRWSK